jgi:hypothetical protein
LATCFCALVHYIFSPYAFLSDKKEYSRTFVVPALYPYMGVLFSKFSDNVFFLARPFLFFVFPSTLAFYSGFHEVIE